MGRSRIAKATVVELQRRITLSERKKRELIIYLQKLKHVYSLEEISYSKYIEIVYKKTDGKTIKQWINYYDNYIEECNKLIKQHKKTIVKNRTYSIFFLLIFSFLLFTAAYYIDLNFTGFIVEGDQVKEITEPEPEEEIIIPEDIQPEIEEEVPKDSEEDSTPSQDEEEPPLIEEEPEIEINETEEEIPEPIENITEIPEENITEEEIPKNRTEEVPKDSEEDSTPSQDEEEPLSEKNITKELEANITLPKILEINITIPENITKTNITEIENASVQTTQFQAILGQPVQWTKTITLNESKPIKVILPKDATNITIKTLTGTTQKPKETIIITSETISTAQKEIEEEIGTGTSGEINLEKLKELQRKVQELEKELKLLEAGLGEVIEQAEKKDITSRSRITGSVISTGKKEVTGNFIVRFFKRVFGAITGRVITTQEQVDIIEVTIDEPDDLNFEIAYETPAPQAIETDTARGKQVKITSPDDIHYENVLAFTNLNENLNIKNPNSVKIHWVEQDIFLPILNIQDKNSNGIYDYIEWIAPKLSNQTFNIIVITKAEHLDSNKDFISNIYEEVKEQDNIWSETINDNEYVRVTFEIPLDSTRDITIWPRTISGNPRIEIYEFNQSTLIAEFTSLNDNQYNKIFLTNLIGSQDTFDLRVVGGSVEFDHIIDPVNDYFVDGTDDTKTAWTTVGSPPYLDIQDTPTNEITVSTANKNHGDFGFPDLPGGATSINSVVMGVYADCGSEKIEVYVWDDGAAAYIVHDLGTCGAYSWNIFSLTEITTVAEVNALKFYVRSRNSGGFTGLVKVDAVNITVDYEETVSDDDFPLFTSLIEDPTDGVIYSSGATYEFNVTITSTNTTTGLEFDGVNYSASNLTTVYNVSSISNLEAGTFSYYWWSYGNGTSANFNISSPATYTVIKAASEVNTTLAGIQKNITIEEGETIDLNCSTVTGDPGYRVALYQDGSLINNGTSPIGNITTFNTVQNENITCFYEGSQNFTASVDTWFVNVTEEFNYPLFTSLTEDPTDGVTYSSGATYEFNVTITSTNTTTGIEFDGVNYSASNLTTVYNVSSISNLEAGTFSYYWWSYGNGTANHLNISSTTTYTVVKAASEVNTTLNGTQANITISSGDTIDLNCSTVTGDVGSFIALYQDGSLINNGTSPIGNITTFNTVQTENVTCFYEGSQNFTASVDTWFVNVTGSALPEITAVFNNSMTDVSTALNVGPARTDVIINFSADLSSGVENLNHSTAMINFTQGTELRESISCTKYEEGTTQANYTCNVSMFWFDSAGTWSINAYIQDNSSNNVTNISRVFDVGQTTGFELGPSPLAWNPLIPGGENQTSINDPLVLNNTGNKEITANNTQINATNLLGEINNAFGIFAGNISVSYRTGSDIECGFAAATVLNTSEYTNITTANLTVGNFTINDGVTGQEEYYFCIRTIGSELTSQAYSTSDQGSWTIRVLLVAMSYKRKKKKKEEKSVLDDLSVPITIFSEKLGALESMTKYLKENLKLSYYEIAKLLNRNERTIWTSYKKATEKQPETLEIRYTKIFVPIKIFKNRKLTVLEATITYLKEKGLKYSEISKLLKRDQRNIWTIYSKAKKKIK